MLSSDRNQRVEGFQRLDRPLETDRSRFDAVFGGGLSHDRTDQIVGQNVRPEFLPDKFRCLASQDIHLHRLFQRSQIKFGVPSRTIELREIVLAELLGIEQRRGDDEYLHTKARLLNADATFPDHQEFGQRIVGLAIDGTGLGRFGPLDNVIVVVQAFSTAKVGFTVRSKAAHAINTACLEHRHLRPGTHQAIGQHDVAWTKNVPQRAEHTNCLCIRFHRCRPGHEECCELSYAETSVPKPYTVYWQVVNTGTEAERANSLRGDFYDSEKTGRSRSESTLYRGMHWVEAFVIKAGICVARSGEFVVNIA